MGRAGSGGAKSIAHLEKFFSQGGMRGIEEEALRNTRESWLRVLVAVRHEYGDVMEPTQGVVLSGEISRLQRLLGAKPTQEEHWEEARERVRQWQRLRQDGEEPRGSLEPTGVSIHD